MGAVNFSIDISLVERLRQALPLSVFVETGTFEGEAVARMLPLFTEIHTIEVSKEIATEAAERFSSHSTVTVYQGNSSEILNSLRPGLREASVLYWLDAHWCVGSDSGGRSQCPLLAELGALEKLNGKSVVLIDDARLFLCTPPHPHEADDWPRLHEIVEELLRLSADHEIMVINDVIVFFPETIAREMSDYARSNSIDWLASLHRLEVLEEEREVLHAALAERLEAINELTDIVEKLRFAWRARRVWRQVASRFSRSRPSPRG
jgi:hypothetical protein